MRQEEWMTEAREKKGSLWDVHRHVGLNSTIPTGESGQIEGQCTYKDRQGKGEWLSWTLKMNHSNAQLMKLPDELLLIILRQLDNVDVLYSLMGLDARLDRILRDPSFTTEINCVESNETKSTQLDRFIDRFCLDILPTIHHRIRWLKVPSSSMERILLVADYPNLSQLDIFVQDKELVLQFNGEWTQISSAWWSVLDVISILLNFEGRTSLNTLSARDWAKRTPMVDSSSGRSSRRSFGEPQSLSWEFEIQVRMIFNCVVTLK